MADIKTVVVFGATGRQGGSVAKVLNTDPRFKVRAVTRKPRSKNAQWLKQIGVEVVQGDLGDFSSLKPILKGTYRCFLVTDFWDHCSKAIELNQGENVVNLARLYGIQHLVFSGLESTWEISELQCEHFQGKANIEKYILAMKVPHTIVHLPQFIENFMDSYPPNKQKNGQYSLDIPVGNGHVYFIPATEIGHCVLKIFSSPEQYKGKTLGLASDSLTIKHCAELMTSELKPLKFYDGKVTSEQYLKEDFANVTDVSNMFNFIKQGKMERDISLTRTLDPCISDFHTWLKKHKEKLLKMLIK